MFILKCPPVGVALLFFCITAKFPSYIASTKDLARKTLIFTRDPDFADSSTVQAVAAQGLME